MNSAWVNGGGVGAQGFQVSVPAPCLVEACGLIVDLPGGGVSANREENLTDLRALGGEHGYIVVQPDAGGRTSTGGLSSWEPVGADDDRSASFGEGAPMSGSVPRVTATKGQKSPSRWITGLVGPPRQSSSQSSQERTALSTQMG